MNERVNKAVTEIITEFEQLPAKEKQYFDIHKTEAWKQVCRTEYDKEVELIRLERIIETIVDKYVELCDEFGDKF